MKLTESKKQIGTDDDEDDEDEDNEGEDNEDEDEDDEDDEASQRDVKNDLIEPLIPNDVCSRSIRNRKPPAWTNDYVCDP